MASQANGLQAINKHVRREAKVAAQLPPVFVWPGLQRCVSVRAAQGPTAEEEERRLSGFTHVLRTRRLRCLLGTVDEMFARPETTTLERLKVGVSGGR